MAQPRWVTWLAVGVAVSLVATLLLRAAGIGGTVLLLPLLFGPLLWRMRGATGSGAACPDCGSAAPAGALYCPYDGTRL